MPGCRLPWTSGISVPVDIDIDDSSTKSQKNVLHWQKPWENHEKTTEKCPQLFANFDKNILILRKLGKIFCLFLQIFLWFLSVWGPFTWHLYCLHIAFSTYHWTLLKIHIFERFRYWYQKNPAIKILIFRRVIGLIQ